MVSGPGLTDMLAGSSTGTENMGRFTSSKTHLKCDRVPGAARSGDGIVVMSVPSV